MAIPSRVLGAGTSGVTTTAICGDVASSLTATGIGAGDSLALSAVYNRVSAGTALSGVKLPPAEAGAMVFVANDTAVNILAYPQTGATIDAANSSSILSGKRRLFIGISPTVWVSILGA